MQQPPHDQQPLYPMQQPPYSPMMTPPPPKKRRTWLWIVLGAVAVLALGCVGLVAIASTASPTSTVSTSTQAPATAPPTLALAPTDTPIPTSIPKWTTVQTFKGNGSKKTPSFTVPDGWRIAWTCDPSSFGGTDYNVIITVENTDGSYADSGVNSTCSASNTHDMTNVPSGGTFILDIISEGDWTIAVQALK